MPMRLRDETGRFIKYANRGAIRNRPLSPKLIEALKFLPDMGVSAMVFSGGQPAKGNRRTGSRRHDHGNSADVFFYKDGKRLSWDNPDDLPVFQEIVSRGKANGLTGFGAGPGYMKKGSMHIGFGKPGVWGRHGKSVNAPEWLRTAYEAPVPEAPAGNSMLASVTPPENPLRVADAAPQEAPQGLSTPDGTEIVQASASPSPASPAGRKPYVLDVPGGFVAVESEMNGRPITRDHARFRLENGGQGVLQPFLDKTEAQTFVGSYVPKAPEAAAPEPIRAPMPPGYHPPSQPKRPITPTPGYGVDPRVDRPRTELSPADETAFKDWYGGYASENQLDPNPDDLRHQYDYRGWWKSFQNDPSMGPVRSPHDGRMHGPSEFKDPDHPTMWKEKFMQATGKDPDDIGLPNETAANAWLKQFGPDASPFDPIPPQPSLGNPNATLDELLPQLPGEGSAPPLPESARQPVMAGPVSSPGSESLPAARGTLPSVMQEQPQPGSPLGGPQTPESMARGQEQWARSPDSVTAIDRQLGRGDPTDNPAFPPQPRQDPRKLLASIPDDNPSFRQPLPEYGITPDGTRPIAPPVTPPAIGNSPGGGFMNADYMNSGAANISPITAATSNSATQGSNPASGIIAALAKALSEGSKQQEPVRMIPTAMNTNQVIAAALAQQPPRYI